MCIRDSGYPDIPDMSFSPEMNWSNFAVDPAWLYRFDVVGICLLYTSDAADERSSVDLGGRRIIKKKNKE